MAAIALNLEALPADSAASSVSVFVGSVSVGKVDEVHVEVLEVQLEVATVTDPTRGVMAHLGFTEWLGCQRSTTFKLTLT